MNRADCHAVGWFGRLWADRYKIEEVIDQSVYNEYLIAYNTVDSLT